MNLNKLNLEELYLLSEDELYKALTKDIAKGQIIQIDTATPIIAEPHSNLSLASEYIRLLVFGETIAPFCETINWEEVCVDGRVSAVRFTLQPKDAKSLAQKLIWFSSMAKLFDEPEDQSWGPANTDTSEYEDLTHIFKDELNERVHYFPELAESAVRNLIVGLSEEYYGEELQEIYTELRVAYSSWWDESLECKE